MMKLDELKAGDFVAIRDLGGFGLGSMKKVSVARTTATRVVLADGQAFTRRGSLVGSGSWSRVCVDPWDEEKHPAEMERIRQERALNTARRTLAEYAWRSVTAEQAGEAMRLIESWTPPAKAPQ